MAPQLGSILLYDNVFRIDDHHASGTGRNRVHRAEYGHPLRDGGSVFSIQPITNVKHRKGPNQ